MGSGAAEPVQLRLEGTREVLARYRARIPEGAAPPPPAPPAANLPDLLQRFQRLMGN